MTAVTNVLSCKDTAVCSPGICMCRSGRYIVNGMMYETQTMSATSFLP